MNTMVATADLQVYLEFLEGQKESTASITITRKDNAYCFHPEKQSSACSWAHVSLSNGLKLCGLEEQG
jgi:hypothetical protein